MKMKAETGKKLRYGGMSAALTALIIAAVIIVNVIFSALAQKLLWYTDLTPEPLYTLSQEFLDIIAYGDAKFEESSSPVEMVDKIRAEKLAEDPNFDVSSLMINIVFCSEPDVLQSNFMQNCVYSTALELQQKFPEHINVEYYNIHRNPTAVAKYKANSRVTIETSSVIIEFGTEYRVRPITSFFTFEDSSSTEPWAYNGEKAFAASILAVTRAESPLACLTSNHGEQFADEMFINTLVDAGYDVQALDLASEEIPEECRLIIVFNPDTDFHVPDGVTDIDEISKLDDFLDKGNAMMVFMDADTVKLDNFEEFLEEWGISYNRDYSTGAEQPCYVRESAANTLLLDQSSSKYGYTFKAQYVTAGLGGSLTETMRDRTPKNIVFGNAMSISYSSLYEPMHFTPSEEQAGKAEYDYGYYYMDDGRERMIYDVFTTSADAVSVAGGVEVGKATALQPLKLMTVSVERNYTQEDDYGYSVVDEASYVFACGSVEFASSTLLQSNSYGNTDLLLTALNQIGREPVPVGLDRKPLSDKTIDTVTQADATQYTVVLALVPAVAAIACGVVVLVRRKYR